MSRASGRETLQLPDDLEQFSNVLPGQWRDSHPGLMGGRGNDIAFSLEPLKRGTDRSSADPKAIGDLRFHDPRAGSQLPPDNQVP
ncbi:MAG: hypothetical protein NVSMB53_02080 [Gemmatimonadaceae bacterium]